MVYLSDSHISQIGASWTPIIDALKESVALLHDKEYAQPIKPYLRYKDPVNRIIAMPAFLGGKVNKSGIKWIASFPGNLDKGLSRAHSVTILNEADTGIPFCIINTNKVSAVRTAGISGLVVREFLARRSYADQSLKVAIIGFGPIGQMHLDMLYHTCFDKIGKVSIYDLRPPQINDLPFDLCARTELVESWQEAYDDADIVITCTVSKQRYIDIQPKKGSLQLNVSLRDYQAEAVSGMQRIVVDDWEEICRENTDIEMLHQTQGLQKENTYSFSEHSLDEIFAGLLSSDTLMFNPMGMAIFDISVAWHYYQESKRRKINVTLD